MNDLTNILDVAARSLMALHPELPQDMSLDEFVYEHGEQLTDQEKQVSHGLIDLYMEAQ